MRHLESPCHEFWNSETELWCASSFLYMTITMTKCLCIKHFHDFAFHESGDEASRLSKSWSPKPRNGAYLNWLLPFSWLPAVTTGCAKKVLHILWVFTPCFIDSKSVKFQSLATCPMIRRFRFDLDSTTQIISRFRISRFWRSCGYVSCLSKSQFVKLWNGVESMV